jgi:uncharacterized membrane protein YkoI
MTDKLKMAAGTAAAIAALGLGGTAIAGASGRGSDTKTEKPVAGQESDRGGDKAETPDKPITGQALQRAKAVALQATGGGKVTETEVGDEEGAYEVEVTRADGSQVDVHLDERFNVIDQSSDGGKRDERGHQD